MHLLKHEFSLTAIEVRAWVSNYIRETLIVNYLPMT